MVINMVQINNQELSEKNVRYEKTNEKANNMDSNKKYAPILVDPKINVRIVLAALWITHFLLWTFGDMVSLLQETTEPISNNLLLFVAAPLAVCQAFLILISLTGKPKQARCTNLFATPVYLLFNIP